MFDPAHIARAYPFVAEGVENEQQANPLRLLRCDEAQGYLYSKPVPPDEVPGLIRAFGAGKATGARGGAAGSTDAKASSPYERARSFLHKGCDAMMRYLLLLFPRPAPASWMTPRARPRSPS